MSTLDAFVDELYHLRRKAEEADSLRTRLHTIEQQYAQLRTAAFYHVGLLDPLAPITNFMLGVTMSGGDVKKARAYLESVGVTTETQKPEELKKEEDDLDAIWWKDKA